MKRNDVVGRKITRIMRDEIVIERGEPPLPGISDGVYRFFNVFVELDGRDLMEVGQDRRYEPLKFVSNEIREHLTDVTLREDTRGCIGEVITEVLTMHQHIMFRLSSARYFWVRDDLSGTDVWLDQAEDVAEELLTDYWEGPQSPH